MSGRRAYEFLKRPTATEAGGGGRNLEAAMRSPSLTFGLRMPATYES